MAKNKQAEAKQAAAVNDQTNAAQPDPAMLKGGLAATADEATSAEEGVRPDDADAGEQIDGQGLEPIVVAPTEPEGEKVECAVLHDNVYGKHGEIIQLDADIAEAARASGYVDTHPNAIKFFREQAEQ